ncbi:aldo/keto reductase, partial [Pseudomonas syringae pv. tagetis]
MNYRTLVQCGLKVSTLTVGSIIFGEQSVAEESLRI